MSLGEGHILYILLFWFTQPPFLDWEQMSVQVSGDEFTKTGVGRDKQKS